MSKERILLKLSGASFKTPTESSIFSHDVIDGISKQIQKLSENYAVSVVIGGGNIWRGSESNCKHIRTSDAHVIGMMSTVINGIALQNYLNHQNVKSTIFTSFPVPRVSELSSLERIDRALNSGEVAIFAAGTGMTFVSTDTCAAIRALETESKRIFVGKNGVEGLYDSDPKKNPNAKFIERISYEEVISRELSVMDLTSMIILRDNARPKLMIFNQDEEDSFLKAVEGSLRCSEVY